MHHFLLGGVRKSSKQHLFRQYVHKSNQHASSNTLWQHEKSTIQALLGAGELCISITFFHDSRLETSPHHLSTFFLDLKSSPTSVPFKYCALGRWERSASVKSSPAKYLLSFNLLSYTSSTLVSLASFCLIRFSSCLIFILGAKASWKTRIELGGLKFCPSASSHWSIDAFSKGFVPNSPLFPWFAYLSQTYLDMALDSGYFKGYGETTNQNPHSRRYSRA